MLKGWSLESAWEVRHTIGIRREYVGKHGNKYEDQNDGCRDCAERLFPKQPTDKYCDRTGPSGWCMCVCGIGHVRAPSFLSYSRVKPAIGQINQQVDQNDKHRNDECNTDYHGIVAFTQGIDEQTAGLAARSRYQVYSQ